MDCKIDQRYSRASNRERDVPSFIEPRPPMILNPFMRPKPQKGTNLLELFEEDSIEEEVPELVQVYLRLKPTNVQSNLYEVKSDKCLVTSLDTTTAGHGRRTQHNVSKTYAFSHIFGPAANQKEIFEHVVKDNLRKLPEGYNFTLLTYGASGSGKTYTLMGTVKSPGLVPRSLEYVFNGVVDAAQMPLYHPGESRAIKLSLAEQENELQWVRHLRHLSAPLREKYRRMSTRLVNDMGKSTLDLTDRTKHYVWVSFVEIYNEAIYDLLATSERTAASKLRIREDPNGNAYVKGATQAFVRTGEEAYDVMVAGKHNLQVHATGVHAQSSRSHCIFTITMLTETENGVRHSYVRLCDLAGSERARRTRNTGARMVESRAINTSLHVLERCLHTLRRKQTRAQDLVPYRESKLTRLLGAGLSGARGEAVSMVVTVNPAPAHALETKHVLQLAAVARDIHVNNTIAESILTLESSSCSQDTTVVCGAEVTRLRADNERLHYELVQAQALNEKLMADMADKQEENALTVRELVDEARDITQQYYKAQLHSLEQRHEAELAELREEYETQLSKEPANSEEGTPALSLKNKIIELMQQMAILEEELSSSRLARARAEQELQHLRACLDERDGKASDHSDREDAAPLSDSDDDADDANDCLEPTFKKEDINRSRLIMQNSLNITHNTTYENINKTSDTLKDDSFTDETKDSTVPVSLTDDQTEVVESLQIDSSMTVKNESDMLKDDSLTDKDLTDETENLERDSIITVENEKITDETYDVSDNDSNNQSIDCPATVKKADRTCSIMNIRKVTSGGDFNNEIRPISRETYFVNDSKISCSGDTEIDVSLKDNCDDDILKVIKDVTVNKPVKPIDTQIEKVKKIAMTTASSDTSLTNFELEEAKIYDKIGKPAYEYFDDGANGTDVISSRKIKEKKQYFDNIAPSIKVDTVTDLLKKNDILRSPSIVQEDIPENYEPTTINKLMRESFTKIADPPLPFNKSKLLRSHDSIDIFEEVDSPCQALDFFKSVEQMRKFVGKISSENECNEKNNQDLGVVFDKEAGPVKPKAKSVGENSKESRNSLRNQKSPPKKILQEHSDESPKAKKRDPKSNVSPKLKDRSRITDNEINKFDEIKPDLLTKYDILPKHTSPKKETQIKEETFSPRKEKTVRHKDIKSEVLPTVSLELNALPDANKTSVQNNTLEAFEDIYKDITLPRATDFELLVAEKTNETLNLKNNTEEPDNKNKSYPHLVFKTENTDENKHTEETNDNLNTSEVKSELTENTDKVAIKYNLRHKKGEPEINSDILVENTAKCANKAFEKPLRLRRQKKRDNDDIKLKDIVNLQKEFSDVTLDVPAPVKIVEDMPSPDKVESENLPPQVGVQSCPSKSVTRSRRKLFTPRPEPLDESPPAGSGDPAPPRVPRPSYHRARTRRRL